jgi:phage terminase Nu1 subunit (DNA packaging protein)
MSAVSLDNAGIGRLFGVTPRTISDLCARGVIMRRGNRFDRDEAVLAYVGHLREVAARRGQVTVADERKRVLQLQGDRAEVKLKQERGELVALSEAVAITQAILRSVRTKILALPARLGGMLPGLSRQDVEVRPILPASSSAIFRKPLAKAQPRLTMPRSRRAGVSASRSSRFRCLLFPTRRS